MHFLFNTDITPMYFISNAMISRSNVISYIITQKASQNPGEHVFLCSLNTVSKVVKMTAHLIAIVTQALQPKIQTLLFNMDSGFH